MMKGYTGSYRNMHVYNQCKRGAVASKEKDNFLFEPKVTPSQKVA